MEKEKKIIYTESAEIRFKKLNSEIKEKIEDYVRENKNVPGDEFIEVTANDLDEVSKRIRIVSVNKNQLKYLVMVTYSIFGVILTITGLFYDDIMSLLKNSPERILLIFVGIFLTGFSVYYYYLVKQRELREREILYKDVYRNILIDKASIINKLDEKHESDK